MADLQEKDILNEIIGNVQSAVFSDKEQEEITGAIFFTKQSLGGITYYEFWLAVENQKKNITTFYEDNLNFGGNELTKRILNLLRKRADRKLSNWIPQSMPRDRMNSAVHRLSTQETAIVPAIQQKLIEKEVEEAERAEREFEAINELKE